MEDDEDFVRNLLATLEQAGTPDKRIAGLQALDNFLSQQLETSATLVLREESDEVVVALRSQLKYANPLVSSKALAVTLSLTKLLSISSAHHERQAGHHVRFAIQQFLPLLVEKLADHRERWRELSRHILVELARAAVAITPAGTSHLISNRGQNETAFSLFERLLAEHGLTSKIGKTKEQTLLLLPILRTSIDKFPIRPFLPHIVNLLGDADPFSREAARSTCITLFSQAPPTAKAELKRELEKKAVRKQTADAILAQVFANQATDAAIPGTSTSTQPEPVVRSSFQASTAELKRTSTLIPPSEGASAFSNPSRSGSSMGHNNDAADVKPIYIASQWDLDRTFSAMLPHFVGKETEQNWQPREQSILKLRGMIKTSTHESFTSAFVSGLRQIQDGILKAVASLRTTLSIHGITLVTELAEQLGDDLEVVADAFLTALIRMAGFTKKIVANASQSAVKAILTNVTFKHKYLDLVWQSFADKNPVTRIAMCQHFVTILSSHGKHRRHALEAHNGLELLNNFCKKALMDPNKDVRAFGRDAFFIVEDIWPQVARTVLDSLDQAARRQVDAGRAGVTASQVSQTPGSRTGPGPAQSSILSPMRTPGSAAKPSSALLAAKRAAAAALAQQRREREAAEAQAEEERDVVIQEEGETFPSVSNFSPSRIPRAISPPSPSPSPPRTSQLQSPLRVKTGSSSSGPSSPPGSSVPLPASPGAQSSRHSSRPSLSYPNVRARTTSTSSASSNRSAGRFGAGATASAAERYGSIAQRFDQSPSQIALERRDRSHSSSTAQSSIPRPRNASNSSHVFGGAATVDSQHLRRTNGSQASAVPGADDNANRSSAPSSPTPRSPLEAATALGHPAIANGSSPSSPTRASRLPRPISMSISPGIESGLERLKVNHSSHVHSQDEPVETHMGRLEDRLPTREVAPSPATPAKPEVAQGEPLVDGPEVVDQETAAPFQPKTPIPAKTTSGVKWFLGKASRLDHAKLPSSDEDYGGLSPVKRRPESKDYVGQLKDGTAGLRAFKSLVSLSKEFKLPARPLGAGDGFGESDGALGLTETDDLSAEYSVAIAMWQDGQLFERLFEAVSTYLRSGAKVGSSSSSSAKDLQTAALVLLHRLVENQFGLFATLGRERDLMDLLLDMIGRYSSGSVASNIKSACQAIADRWADQTDIVVGIATVRGTVLSHLVGKPRGTENEAVPAGTNGAGGDGITASVSNSSALSEEAAATLSASSNTDTTATVAVFSFALRCLARLFSRLPVEVVEEQMERCKALIKRGLNHRQIETRQQAVNVLVSANSRLHDPQSLFSILQPIDKAQQDLLIYYMNKA